MGNHLTATTGAAAATPAFDRTDTPITSLAGEGLQLEIASLLTELHELNPFISALVTSYQRSVGFIGAEGIAEQDAAVRVERRLQAVAAQQGRPPGHGATPAPGNFRGIAVDVDLWYTTIDILRRLDAWHVRNNPDYLPETLPEAATIGWILDHIRPLVWGCTRDQLLRLVVDELRAARDAAEQLLHGEDRLFLGACPHCERPTLVAYFDQGLIRCGRDQNTSHYHPCTCSDPLCECKSRPVAHRHTWWNHRGNKPDGWKTLASRIRIDQLAHPTH